MSSIPEWFNGGLSGWQRCWRELSTVLAYPPGDPRLDGPLTRVMLFAEFQTPPRPMPQADWNTLVLEVQVCL